MTSNIRGSMTLRNLLAHQLCERHVHPAVQRGAVFPEARGPRVGQVLPGLGQRILARRPGADQLHAESHQGDVLAEDLLGDLPDLGDVGILVACSITSMRRPSSAVRSIHLQTLSRNSFLSVVCHCWTRWGWQ